MVVWVLVPSLLLLLTVVAAAATRDSIAPTEQWGVWELELRGPVELPPDTAAGAVPDVDVHPSSGSRPGARSASFVANPFADVHLDATLTLANVSGSDRSLNRDIVVRGFYDGAGIYRLRFSPPEPGRWSYRTRSSHPSLSGKSGTIDVVPADPLSGNHGPVVSKGYELFYADGTPHYSTGTTCYQWASMPKAMQERTLQTLTATNTTNAAPRPFNKIRMTVFPKWYQYNHQNPVEVGTVFPITPGSVAANSSAWGCVGTNCPSLKGSFDLTRFNVSFWQNYEHLIQRLDAANIIADIIVFHPYDDGHWGFDCLGGVEPETYDTKHDEYYLEYLTARLSAYKNVWWAMANEWSLCACKSYGATPYANSTTKTWDRLFETLAANDPYRRQTSIHNGPLLYNHSRPWITHVSLQGHIDDTAGLRMLYKKPVIWDEVKYEGNITSEWGALSGIEESDRFWWGAIKGVYVGHSETVLDWQLPAGDDKQPLWWSKGGELRGTSATRIAWFRAIHTRSTSLVSNNEENGEQGQGQANLGLSLMMPLVGPAGHAAVIANGLGVWAETLTAKNGSQMLLRFVRPGAWDVPLPTQTEPPPPGLCAPVDGIDCNNGDIRNGGVASTAAECCAMCAGEASCMAWTWNRGYNGDCWLKTSCPPRHRSHDPNVVSGIGQPLPPAMGQDQLAPSPASAYAYDVYTLDFWEMEVKLLQTVGPGNNATTVTAESVPFNVLIMRREVIDGLAAVSID